MTIGDPESTRRRPGLWLFRAAVASATVAIAKLAWDEQIASDVLRHVLRKKNAKKR